MLSDDALNAKAAEWGDRVAGLADELEAAALEWKLDRAVLEEIPMGIDRAAKIDPGIDFALPHAGLVMQLARDLRSIVAELPKED